MSTATPDPDSGAMSPGAMERFLARPVLARLATTSGDRPRVLPMWFWWDGARVWMETNPEFPNARILRANPHAAVTIDETLGGLRFRAVVMRGTIDVIDGPDDLVAETVRRIYGKYLDADLEKEQAQGMLHGPHVLLRFTPEHVVSWDDTGSEIVGVAPDVTR